MMKSNSARMEEVVGLPRLSLSRLRAIHLSCAGLTLIIRESRSAQGRKRRTRLIRLRVIRDERGTLRRHKMVQRASLTDFLVEAMIGKESINGKVLALKGND